MDGFELNKIMGAVLGTLLVLLGVNIVAGGIFASEKPAKPGFEIAVASGPSTAVEKAAPQVPLEQLLASADVKKGETVAKKCHICHSFEKGGPNKVGPDLYGIVGRERATHGGFAYSDAMKKHPGKWTLAELDEFLTDPRKMIPGTAMAFAGLSKATDRANLLVYLNTLSENPQPLPTAPKEGAAQNGDQAAPAGDTAAPAPAKQ